MRYESKRRPRGGKGGRKGDEQIKRYFFLSSCEFVKESKNDFLSSRRVCDSPAMNNDELCAVMNPRQRETFSRTRALFTLFSFLLFEQYFHTCACEKHSRRSFGKYFRAIRSTLRAARLLGDRRHSRGYNFIAGDRIGRRCIRPTGVNPLRGESQQDEEGNGVGEEE